MKYITNNELLTAYIPNVVTAVVGEKDLFTKITPHLTMAEAWLEANVVKYDDISSNENAMTYAKIIVANEGFRKAIPSLDLILTANGFGIVSDNNVAPASRDRVNALLDGLQATVDEAIEALAVILNGQHIALTGTVFRGYEAQRMQEVTKDFFARWRADKPKIIATEEMLARRVLSSEVLTALRNYAYDTTVNESLSTLAFMVKQFVVRKLTDKMAPVEGKHVARQMVDWIRKHPTDFPDWEQSEAAKYWADYTFKNDKKSGGFWL